MTERRGSVMESDNTTRHSASDCRSYPEEALGLPYYHPTIMTMREVRDIFLKYLETNGFYLIRKSFTKSSTLTVSVVFNQSIKHFTISQKETGAYFLQRKLFASIQDLVGYYGKQEVPNKEEISGIYLKHPVLDLNRHHFFTSTCKRQAFGEETRSQARTRNNSWQEKNDDQRTDRLEHDKLKSQSFSVKTGAHISECELGNKKFDARNGSTSNVPFAQRSCQDRPFSGYLQLDLNHQSDATICDSTSRSMSQCSGTGGGRRRSSGPVSLSPDDRTSSNHPPKSPSFQSRSPQDRPRPQLPQEEAQRTIAQSPSGAPTAMAPAHLHYCYARSPYTQLAPSLVERLRKIEGDNAIKCQCGIYHDDAELPRGWSFHRSTEPQTYGRVLFTGPDGQLDWNLPLEVSLELSADQQDKIRDVICRSPPQPCSHLLDARGSGFHSATSAVMDSVYQALNKQDT